jgi:glutaredoxin-like YruB-family protein
MDASKKIVVYSTPTCPHCKRAKQFLEERSIPFQVVDVAADKAAREEMINKSGQMGVPVIDIDGVLTVGFDEAALKRQLGL